MKKPDEIFTDEKGNEWKTIKEIPCPRNLKPRTQTFKICFEVEYELELKESQIPHTHIVRERENSESKSLLEKHLTGAKKDFGMRDCLRMEATSKPNIKVKQTSSVKTLDNSFPENYEFQDKEFCRINSWIFQDEIEYLEKNLSNELKDIFLKLWNESKKESNNNRKKAIKSLLSREAKNLRKRLKTHPKRPTKDEYKEFIKKCCDKIKTLKRNRQPITRKSLANKLHDEKLNSSETLFRRQLKKFSIGFKELLFECEEKDKIPPRK